MTKKDKYAEAGVDIDAGNRAAELMAKAVHATYGPEVLSETGNFGGLFAADALKAMDNPVLVASTDGVGTKTKVAAQMDKWDTVGQDIVNHCINDILVQGAQPLFFLDYVASAAIDPEQVATIVAGAAKACGEAGCALLGGETAEMPGVYEPGEVDVAGTIVGVVDKNDLITGKRIKAGDAIIGLKSTGLHTNGFSLARMILGTLNWNAAHPALGMSIGEALLAVHRSYLEPVNKLRENGIDIRGLAHITGGGIIENLPRILPDQVGAVIKRGTWHEPTIFTLMQETGGVRDLEMFRVFNMGLGLLVVIPQDQVERVLALLPDDGYRVGEIVSGDKKVEIV